MGKWRKTVRKARKARLDMPKIINHPFNIQFSLTDEDVAQWSDEILTDEVYALHQMLYNGDEWVHSTHVTDLLNELYDELVLECAAMLSQDVEDASKSRIDIANETALAGGLLDIEDEPDEDM